MKKRLKPTIGERFGCWTVMSTGFLRSAETVVTLECDCGFRCIKRYSRLTSKHCGTSKCRTCSNKIRKNKKSMALSATEGYKCWEQMVYRCTNPNAENYSNYGKRGIGVCDRWLGDNGFENFISDMGDRPSRQYTVDRIDPNGNYCPKNCRWATHAEQSRNKSNNVNYTLYGETKCCSDWAKQFGMSHQLLRQRMVRGLTLEQALTTPVAERTNKTRIFLTFNGKTASVKEWSQITGIPETTIRSRKNSGLSDKEILSTPPGLVKRNRADLRSI